MKWHGRTILTALMAGPLLSREVAEAAGLQTDDVHKSLGILHDRGLIRSGSGVHEITAKGRAWVEAGLEVTSGPQAGKSFSRRTTTLRDRAWRAMRIKHKFDLDGLLYLVANGDEKVAESNLRRYLRALERAGYLVKMRSGWLLTEDRDTGPLAPSLNTRTKMVTDVNTGEKWNLG